MVTETDISDYITTICIRYFRNAIALPTLDPYIPREDLDLLISYWALSKPVSDLLEHLERFHFEMRPSLLSKKSVSNGQIVGQLDAVATEMQRLRTGNPANVVSSVPYREYLSRNNMLVAWLVDLVHRYCASLHELAQGEGATGRRVASRLQQVLGVARTETLKSISAQHVGARYRPRSQDIVSAGRSGVQTYRLAVAAVDHLRAITNTEQSALRSLVADVMVGPQEVWRRYELAVLLALARAFSDVTGAPMVISSLLPTNKTPVASVGDVAFYWQMRTSSYKPAMLEPSEIIVQDFASQFGRGPAVDRPDIVVRSEATGEVVAIVEVKWFEQSGNVSDALYAAVDQIVRYSRGYSDMSSIRALTGVCVIALAATSGIHAPVTRERGLPFLFSAEQLLSGEAAEWAKALRQRLQ